MYVGLDVHKRYCYYAMVDGKGTVVKKDRFRTTGVELEEFANALPVESQVAIEASASGSFVYEQLDEQGVEVHLAHPTMVRPFAKQHVKTDKIDAIVLAQLLRMEYLPESYVPGEEMRDLRTLVRHRAGLVRIRTSLKNRVHALLTMEGVQPPAVSDLFGKRGREFLETVKIREPRRLALDNYLRVLDVLSERITRVEETMEEKAELTKEVGWLESLPGIGFHNALLILSELGEVTRFSSPQALVCYAGLVPKVAQSGDQVRYPRPYQPAEQWLSPVGIDPECLVRGTIVHTESIPAHLSKSEGKERHEGGDRGHRASSGRIGLLGVDQARSLS
jgi:transposase